jgi:hypothetical protein
MADEFGLYRSILWRILRYYPTPLTKLKKIQETLVGSAYTSISTFEPEISPARSRINTPSYTFGRVMGLVCNWCFLQLKPVFDPRAVHARFVLEGDKLVLPNYSGTRL